jgi:ABC-type Fe3+-hydroxamate transport system substrate-binding protein
LRQTSGVPARRIVSLCPSITETLVAIGGRRRLVGATRYCVRPKGLLWGLPRVGGTKDPDVSRVLALEPDLVFANAEENRLEDVRAIEAAGIPVDVTMPRTVAQVPPDIRRWGERLEEGAAEEASALAGRLESEIASLEGEPPLALFSYAYWIWKDPWMTVSDDTYVADLLRMAGGRNVFGSAAERYPSAVPEEAIARGADVHFFPSEPYPFRPARHEESTAAIFGRQALRLFVEGDDYCWHGVRTLDGLRAMRQLRHEIARRKT